MFRSCASHDARCVWLHASHNAWMDDPWQCWAPTVHLRRAASLISSTIFSIGLCWSLKILAFLSHQTVHITRIASERAPLPLHLYQPRPGPETIPANRFLAPSIRIKRNTARPRAYAPPYRAGHPWPDQRHCGRERVMLRDTTIVRNTTCNMERFRACVKSIIEALRAYATI